MGVSTLRTVLSQNGFFWLYLIFLSGFYLFPSASTLSWYYSLFVLAPLLFFRQDIQTLLRQNRLFWLAATYIGYLLLTVLWSDPIAPQDVFVAAWHGLQILGFCAATGLIWLHWHQRIEFLMSRWVWVAAATAIVSILVWYGSHPFPKERLQTLGIMHHEVKAACAYGIAFMFSLHLVQISTQARTKALYSGVCLLLATVVLLSQSRTALGALILGSVVLWGWRSLFLVVPLGLVSFSLLILYPDLLAEQGRTGSSFRLGIWSATYDSFKDHLLFGIGYFSDTTVSAYNRTFDHAHSAYLATLRDGGLVGLSLMAAVLVEALRRGFRLWQIPGCRLYPALLVFGMACLLLDFDRLVTRPKELWLFFWLPLALLMVANRITSEPGQPAAMR